MQNQSAATLRHHVLPTQDAPMSKQGLRRDFIGFLRQCVLSLKMGDVSIFLDRVYFPLNPLIPKNHHFHYQYHDNNMGMGQN
jgi:hypothetical protein